MTKILAAVLATILCAGPALALVANPARIGGDGSDSAVTVGAVTDTSPRQINSTNFVQSASTTWTVFTGTVVNATGTITISGTVLGDGNGYSGGVGGKWGTSAFQCSQCGGGPSGGGVTVGDSAISTSTFGGAGGGNGGAGGNGGSPNATVFPRGGGPVNLALGAGSGGSAGMGDSSNNGGSGGYGGAFVRFIAKGAISIGGTLGSRGGGGLPAAGGQAGGGGGGAGGTFGLYSAVSITNSGSVLLNGGNGGSAASTSGGAGGGGGGGICLVQSPSNTLGTITTSGGAAGFIGSATLAAQSGFAGVTINLSTTPNVPFIALKRSSDLHAQYGGFMVAHCQMLRALGMMTETEPYCMDERLNAAQMIALKRNDEQTRFATAFREYRTGIECGTGRKLSPVEQYDRWLTMTAEDRQVVRDERTFDQMCLGVSAGQESTAGYCIGDWEELPPCV